ncbi:MULTISPECIES: CHAT domain-containing protein [Pseudomonadota]|jgi:CHAT domain-containing protein|uniref:CHAT domain-containing protein n=1 Tax=Pseudomonadota TaxID=1224 RepID=UPI00076A9C6E|nr:MULTISPECIES: CHAT domain-containing protein [Pseudomonadota]MAF61256.1 CHAT domain-containing protein [Blastomonas sp.]
MAGIGILAVAYALAASGAAEARLPDAITLCDRPVADLPAAALPLASARARQARSLMRGGDNGADAALELLLAPADHAPSTPLARGEQASVAQLAEYCLVAGEAMRRARSGSQARAQDFLRTAQVLAEQAGDKALAARAAWEAALALAGGAPPAAPGARRRSAASAPPASAPQGCAPADIEGQGRRLEAAFACALDRAVQADDPALTALAALRLARLEKARKADIAPRIAQGLAASARVEKPGDRASLLRALVMLADDAGLGKTDMVRDAVELYADLARQGAGDAATLAALKGRIALAEGERQGAQAAIRRAIFLESQKPVPQNLPHYALLLADAEPERAGEHVIAAYRALERVRPVLMPVDPLTEESRFDLLVRPVFERAIGTTLAVAGSDAGTLDQAQRIAEAYRSAELQNSLGAECVPLRNPVTPADLKPGEVLLYPLLLEDRIELLYATGDDKAKGYRRMPPDRSRNRAMIAALAQRMTASLSGASNDWEAASRELHAALIAPVIPLLGPEATLIVVPDGPLRQISFAALMDAQGTFLMEQARLAVVPALSFAAPGTRDTDPEIIAASLEKEIDLPVGRFTRLEGTASEAAMAAGQDGVLLTDFDRAELAAALAKRPASVLHLATHAAFNGRTERSFVVANGEAISLPELRAMLSANSLRGQGLQLLVLSACETAVGDDDQAMGLAGAAVEAGAASALASLWEVSDAGTAALMEAFYRHYRAGAGRARSLQLAQIELARGADGQWADPGIWSAFTLVGSWR